LNRIGDLENEVDDLQFESVANKKKVTETESQLNHAQNQLADTNKSIANLKNQN
jgi:peptidoglycan hydrolase CwlO-like protein